MANRAATITATEIKRTLQATIAAGIPVGRIEVDHATGKVTVFPAGSSDMVAPNPWDPK